ncbi:zinc finger protein GLI1-like [Phymastichus coffea]|uniref:zinc finger protein GLI1-like n=1 Tax=Phymastichus coffea TaxID=108790 RepID=UPI00273C61BA|nr:zinc finger protein GLI1-like [Phymastichus coffea]XP_058788933.1 zinc finger protein GLI1-like [Phymastichus coffea]XP_058788934.1 zinc finger protein GLI1-like [Phymastichus coffea]XP_058788935.1 zinc finger protein GLI1-like [Phymastichus coffea]XP_058788936.1 zinc finger protein GLI1-like [Phymastichus coffea]
MNDRKIIYDTSGANISYTYNMNQVQQFSNHISQPNKQIYWVPSYNCYYEFVSPVIANTSPTSSPLLHQPLNNYNNLHPTLPVSQLSNIVPTSSFYNIYPNLSCRPLSIFSHIVIPCKATHVEYITERKKIRGDSNNTPNTPLTLKTHPDAQNPLPNPKVKHRRKNKTRKPDNKHIVEVTNSEMTMQGECQSLICITKDPGISDNKTSAKQNSSKQQHICHVDGCNKVYNKTLDLKRHLQWHYKDEKNIFCTYCKKSFPHKDYFSDHFNMHRNTNERKFKITRDKHQILDKNPVKSELGNVYEINEPWEPVATSTPKNEFPSNILNKQFQNVLPQSPPECTMIHASKDHIKSYAEILKSEKQTSEIEVIQKKPKRRPKKQKSRGQTELQPPC